MLWILWSIRTKQNDYFIATSGTCEDDGGHYVTTMEECREAFSSTGKIVNEVLKYKVTKFGRGATCQTRAQRFETFLEHESLGSQQLTKQQAIDRCDGEGYKLCNEYSMDKVGNTLNYVWVEDMNYPVKKNSNPNLPKWQEDTSRTKADAICCQKDVPAFRTFAGMHLDEDGDGFKDWDDTPSVEEVLPIVHGELP